MTTRLPLQQIASPISYATISKRAFHGDILCFNNGGKQLLSAARALCRKSFATATPTKAHYLYQRDEFFARAAEAQKIFNTALYKALFAEWLSEIGVDVSPLYWDMLGLRISPPVATHGGGWRSHIGAHRDTWGTGIQSQINWWAPIWPLANNRTMAFYLEYWKKALTNTTDDWSFEAYLTARKQTPAGHAVDYPSAPRALENPTSPPTLVRMSCGQLLAFSSAHLHASVTNSSLLTRFSLEIRTVSQSVTRTDNGAPNVDCTSEPPLFRLFRSAANNEKLAS